LASLPADGGIADVRDHAIRRAGAESAAAALSYRLCYHLVMPRRTKRSVSLPRDLAQEIDRAATRSGTTFSGWLADTAAHRLRLEAGRRAIAAWEREHGALTADEHAEGLARARSLLGRSTRRSSRRSA
jgi:hypothetical protein